MTQTATKTPSAIHLKNLSVRFGNEVILNSVNLQISEGEIVTLVGPSGKGKSVLLKSMAGLVEPTSGEVLIRGLNVNNLDRKHKQEVLKKMGMLFQKNALFDSLTVAENIIFPLQEVNKIEISKAREIAEKLLEAVGILHAKDLYPDEISGGMQKRLGIARAMALKPEIVFYDDPTAGLDPITSRKIIDLILELQRQQKSTVVVITNDMNRAYQLGGRNLMVVDAEVIETGNQSQTMQHKDPRVYQFIRGLIEGPLKGIAPK